MIITYFGKQFFKVSQGDTTIAFNPISKDAKGAGKIARFGAGIAISTINHPDYNGIETVTYGDTVPFAITSPGDYEINSVFVSGRMAETTIDKKKYINTMYTVTFDDITLCFLGALSETLDASARELIQNSDILFIPIGGDGLLGPKEAYKLAVSLEPKIIIPMDYGAERENGALKAFLKEDGNEKLEAIDKLTIKRKEIEAKDGEVIVLADNS